MRHGNACAAAVLAALIGFGTAGAAPEAKPGPAAKAGAAVDLNTASEDQLQEVPGIGPSLAKKIVEFRKQNGPFKTVDDLLKIRGVGEKSLEKLRPHVSVGKK